MDSPFSFNIKLILLLTYKKKININGSITSFFDKKKINLDNFNYRWNNFQF